MIYQRYSAEELAWIRENQTLTIVEMLKRFAEVFGRTPGTEGLRRKRADIGCGVRRNGVTLRSFVAVSRPKRDVGHERIDNGFIYRKITGGRKKPGQWRLVHRIRWEEVNGPVPSGMYLKCKDGNNLNTDPSNWVLISAAMLLTLNGLDGGAAYDKATPELKPALINLARLKEAMRSIARGRPATS